MRGKSSGVVGNYVRNSQSIRWGIEYLEARNFLSEQHKGVLRNLNLSNKFAVSAIIDAIRTNISDIDVENVGHQEFRGLVLVVKDELRLLSSFDDPKKVERLISQTGIDCGDVVSVERLNSSLNYPFIVRSDRDLFIRYTAPFGSKYIVRSNPREVIFQSVLGELFFKDVLGEDSVMQTLFPTFESAERNRDSHYSVDDIERIRSRIIIQPCYTPEYTRLDCVEDPGQIGNAYGSLIGKIHSRTSGLHTNRSSFVERHFSEIRDKDINEYTTWLRDKCWVGRRFNALKEMHEAVELFSGVEELDWAECVEHSARFWEEGAVVTNSDMRPKNMFHKQGGVRIFDFDYLVFLDPAYHVGQTMYFALRDLKNSAFNADELSTVVSSSLDAYFTEVADSPVFFHSSQYRQTILDYFSITALSRCIGDSLSGQSSQDDVMLIHDVLEGVKNE